MPDVWDSLLGSLDRADSAGDAATALKALLERAGQRAPEAAAQLAKLAGGLKTPEGKQHALNVLKPYAPNVAECVDIALTLSQDDQPAVRLAATQFLAAVRTNPKAQARLFLLLEDDDSRVRNFAIQTVGQMELAGGPEGAASALFLIPDHDQREEGSALLDGLDRAVKTLQDLGLDDGQDRIVDELILPKIAALKELFGVETTSIDEVITARKRSLVTLSGVIEAAKAFALGTSAVANADEAAATVTGTAEALSPLLEMFKGLV